MICYLLRCGAEHEFEAWFRDSAGYDEQRGLGNVTCPLCGDTEIVKALMAPAVARKGSRQANRDTRRTEKQTREAMKAVEQLRDRVEENCDYVGDRFADEARRIHYGETEERGIYGEASIHQAHELHEEGIKVYHLPRIGPRTKN